MPYMSYISMMHLYESLGWFRAGAPVRKVHFAEEWNEMVSLCCLCPDLLVFGEGAKLLRRGRKRVRVGIRNTRKGSRRRKG